MRVLLTGASGFIGAHVAAHLSELGADVRGFCRSEPPAHARAREWVRGELTDRAAVRRAARDCQAIVHTAALYSYSRADAAAMREINVQGTRHVCEAAARAGVRRVVVTSTAATCGPVCGRPATEHDLPPAWELSVPYKRTKLEAERLALRFAEDGLEVVCVNPTTVVGPHDHRPTPTGKMIRDLVEGRISGFVRGAGMNVVGVRDVAHGHALALERGRSGQRYILGGQNLAMADVFAQVAAAVGRRAPRIGLPWGLLYALGWGNQQLRRALSSEPELLVLDEIKLARWPMFFASEKAARELGYAPRPAAAALAEAARWFAASSAREASASTRWRIAPAPPARVSSRSGGVG